MQASLRAIFLFVFFVSVSYSFCQPTNRFKPEIVGQTPSPLTTLKNQPITIKLTDLTVEDKDPAPIYPNGFTLEVKGGKNYKVKGTTVTPAQNFIGSLKVPVRVNDGKNNSKSFDVSIEVVGLESVAPKITGQEVVSIEQGKNLSIELSHLIVDDSDSNYPQDFTLRVFDGNNYSRNENTITPSENFVGNLKVPVSVNDGQNESNRFDLKIEVVKDQRNNVPIITGQSALSTSKNTPIAIELKHLIVEDSDNKYPDDFTLKIAPGNSYSVVGNVVSPSTNFTGILNVGVTVHDGFVDSKPYEMKIEVVSPTVTNAPPAITGQKPISITQNTSVTLQLGHLTVEDPDNIYPNDFVLIVFPGNNYSVEGTTIKPLPNFTTGSLSVNVRVNDGQNDSEPYQLRVQVVSPSSTPKINGQKELSMLEDNTMTINLSDLQVSDLDNTNYPKGFSLTVLPGNKEVYTAEGNKITPALNLNGFIEVGITVSDGANTSEEFKLLVLVAPVNDPPEILDWETKALDYEPGSEPIAISEGFDLRDVDNDHLNMAEIGFRTETYSAVSDELKLTLDSSKIKAIYDPEGILFLVGYATIDDYRTAIRSIRYNYLMTEDENGNPSPILEGARTIYINLHDGQDVSETVEREINIDTKISLDIPNTFTPNGDQTNDTWRLQTPNKDKLNESVIRVYNKRGLLLYESRGFETEWDGVSNGEVLPVDTYYYTIDLNLPYLKKTYKGAVTILH